MMPVATTQNSTNLDYSLVKKDAKTPNRINFGSILHQFFTDFVQFMIQSNEPRIIVKKNAQGDVFYHVYDPLSQEKDQFTSEQDVRVWLEQRYAR
ncbi:hypothetical protein [Spirulina subsalsa]|uniref:hypothetical protein n=1 Tax=Spirulina subsalsa TaxID=54311 RepID=UPI0002EEABF1|nr:hypothetical protein [Spirulina subsalsa]